MTAREQRRRERAVVRAAMRFWRSRGKPHWTFGDGSDVSARELNQQNALDNACWEMTIKRYRIPKRQKRKLSICPHCKKRFFYWQKASEHAQEWNHW